MTDEELIDRLRDVYVRDTIRLTAADRIEQLVATNEQLVAEVKEWNSESLAWIYCQIVAAKDRNTAEAKLAECLEQNALLEARLSKAVDALRLVTDACDEGKMVSLGAGGMTIDAQIRQSVYNKVPAWPIEEARSVLDELGRPE
jgi:hypothetical protein